LKKNAEDSNKKVAYLSFSKKDELRAFQIMDEIDELKKLHFSVKYYSQVKNNFITKSNVTVFFLNNEYLNSEKFKKELNYANTHGIVHIFVLLEKINESTNYYLGLSNNFGVINLAINDPNQRIEILKRFQSLFLRHLLIQNDYFGLKLDSYDIRLMEVKKLKKYKFFSYQYEDYDESICISPDELLLRHSENSLNDSLKFGLIIMNITNRQVIGKIEQDNEFFFSWIENLEQILIIRKRFYHEIPTGSLYHKNGKLIREFIFHFKWKDLVYSVTYDRHGCSLYLLCNFISNHTCSTILKYDENMNFLTEFNCYASANKIKIYNSHCYLYSYESDKLKIFDLSFNIELSMNLSIPIKNLITNQNDHNLIFIQTIENILLLNILNFNIIGRIENPFNLMSVFNNKMLFNDGNEYLFYYRFDFMKRKNEDYSKFICNCSRLKSHILKNACLLPCGNSISLDCLYDNYNIKKDILNCMFCQKVHKIPYKLEKDTKINDLIAESSSDLLKSLLKNGYKISDIKGNLF
jgi:hypothetical protein